MSEPLYDGDLDFGLLADRHLFDDGPDLFNQDLFDRLRESMASPRPADHGFSSYQDVPPPCVFNEDFSIDHTTSLPTQLAPPPIAQHLDDASLGLTFDALLPQLPLAPVPTFSPTALLNNGMAYPQNIPTPTVAPNALPMWYPMGMNDLPQLVGVDQQHQQWPMHANQQAQTFHPQLNFAQHQYSQAAQQLQLAPNQLAQNSQPPLDLRSSQNLHGSQNSQLPQGPHQLQNFQPHNMSPGQELDVSRDPPLALETSPQPMGNATILRANGTQSPTSSHSVERQGESEESSNGTPEQSPTQLSPIDRLAFKSLREAEAAMSARHIGSNWRAPNPDASTPQTQDDRSYWVLQLLEAFEDVTACKDNKQGFSFLKRWQDLGYYRTQEMEKVCWHMLDLAERLHAHGPRAMNIYDPDALKKLKTSRGMTFEQRLQAICDMLRFSKFLCDNLMKGEGIDALVSAPKQKLSGSKIMHVQNQKRQVWLETGRRTNNGQVNEDGNTAELDEEDIAVNHEATTKRKPKESQTSSHANMRSRTVTAEVESSEEDVGSELRREYASEDESTGEAHHVVSPLLPSTPRAATRSQSLKFKGTSPTPSSLSPAPASSQSESDDGNLPSSSKRKHPKSEDKPSLRVKRTRSTYNEPTRKSTTPAPATKTAPARAPVRTGKQQRDANGRFLPRPSPRRSTRGRPSS